MPSRPWPLAFLLALALAAVWLWPTASPKPAANRASINPAIRSRRDPWLAWAHSAGGSRTESRLSRTCRTAWASSPLEPARRSAVGQGQRQGDSAVWQRAGRGECPRPWWRRCGQAVGSGPPQDDDGQQRSRNCPGRLVSRSRQGPCSNGGRHICSSGMWQPARNCVRSRGRLLGLLHCPSRLTGKRSQCVRATGP